MAVNMVIMFGRIGVVFGNLIIPVLDRISCELPYLILAMFNFCKKTNNIFYFHYAQYYIIKLMKIIFIQFFSVLVCHTIINEDKKRKIKNNYNLLIYISSSIFCNATISKTKISNINKLLRNESTLIF